MAFLALYGEYLMLDEIRLALYGAVNARRSATGGGSGGGIVRGRGGSIGGVARSGSLADASPGGSISSRTRSGKIGETR